MKFGDAVTCAARAASTADATHHRKDFTAGSYRGCVFSPARATADGGESGAVGGRTFWWPGLISRLGLSAKEMFAAAISFAGLGEGVPSAITGGPVGIGVQLNHELMGSDRRVCKA
jgi:hypothetical protein